MIDPINEAALYLAPDEKILWQGRNTKRTPTSSSLALMAFGMCSALAIGYFIVFVWQPGSSWGMGLGMSSEMGILLIVLLVFGPVLAFLAFQGRRERNTRYVVTNLAALIVSQGSQSSIRLTTIPFGGLSEVRVIENRDSTGTLMFNEGSRAVASSGGLAQTGAAFWNIEKPWEVYQLIRKQMDELNSR
jgi:hypothetical protein